MAQLPDRSSTGHVTDRSASRTILLTGFGPFPGAPYNPTGPLIARLARLRRPGLTGGKIVTHVFQTSYATVERELPQLIEQHCPDILLMFGLASRTRHIRIETLARNARSGTRDVTGVVPRDRLIDAGGPPLLPMPFPHRRVAAAVRPAKLDIRLSRDAGQYLCNYLCWLAADAVKTKKGPRLAAFIHVPLTGKGKGPGLSLDDLVRAGGLILTALATAR